VALTVMTLFVPCVANFLMMVRERGVKTGLAIVGVITPIAIFTGAGLNYVLHYLGVQF
jgi:ferrous iron transport protein B